MFLDGPSYHGRVPCMLCRHWKRRKSPTEWRVLCGVCRDLTPEEIEFLYWIQEEDDRVVVAPNMFRHSRANSRARYAAARAALGEAGLAAGSRVLDIGCGTSAHAVLFRDFAYVGADLGRSRLRRGRTMNPWARYSVQDINQLGWRDAAFDAVLCLEVIEHIAPPRRQTLVSELFRVLRPGGLLVLSTPDGRLTGWKRVFGRRCELAHEAELPEEEVEALIRGAGAQLVKAAVLDNLILPAGRVWAALLHLIADRPRWRSRAQRLSLQAGYATKLYVAAGPNAPPPPSRG
jgi:2-polyprenyl-3-methyl-5-hydroxy-6-metoxy-1,4-benzoquinol methylase